MLQNADVQRAGALRRPPAATSSTASSATSASTSTSTAPHHKVWLTTDFGRAALTDQRRRRTTRAVPRSWGKRGRRRNGPVRCPVPGAVEPRAVALSRRRRRSPRCRRAWRTCAAPRSRTAARAASSRARRRSSSASSTSRSRRAGGHVEPDRGRRPRRTRSGRRPRPRARCARCTGPVVPPEKRPSVSSRTSLPRPAPLIAPVICSISRMPGPPFGPSQRMTTTSPALQAARGQRVHRGLLAVEDAGGALEHVGVEAGALDDGAVGGQRAAQDREAAGAVDRVAHGVDDLAVGVRRGDVGQVLGHRAAGDGERVAVQQPGVEQRLHHDRHAADAVDVGHHVLRRTA